MSSPKEVQKQSHSCSCQGCKATSHTETLLNLAKHWNSPEPPGTFRKLPPEPTPAHTGTLRNLPEPSGTFRNLPPEATPAHTPELSQTCLRNLHQHTPEPTPAHTGTLRNLPEVASGTHTTTHRNPHQHTPEPSGTFRKLPPEPTPPHTGTHTSTHRNPPEPSGTCLRNLLHQHTPETYTSTHRNSPEPSGTLRNLPEPSSGTCSSNPHRHTPELIWAEDPLSLRCWGIRIVFWVRFFWGFVWMPETGTNQKRKAQPLHHIAHRSPWSRRVHWGSTRASNPWEMERCATTYIWPKWRVSKLYGKSMENKTHHVLECLESENGAVASIHYRSRAVDHRATSRVRGLREAHGRQSRSWSGFQLPTRRHLQGFNGQMSFSTTKSIEQMAGTWF